jgi:hypothetical protein
VLHPESFPLTFINILKSWPPLSPLRRSQQSSWLMPRPSSKRCTSLAAQHITCVVICIPLYNQLLCRTAQALELRDTEVETAVELLGQVLEIRNKAFGENALECADTYLYYGECLFEQAQVGSDSSSSTTGLMCLPCTVISSRSCLGVETTGVSRGQQPDQDAGLAFGPRQSSQLAIVTHAHTQHSTAARHQPGRFSGLVAQQTPPSSCWMHGVYV